MLVTGLGSWAGALDSSSMGWKGPRDLFIQKYLLNLYKVLDTGHPLKSLIEYTMECQSLVISTKNNQNLM